MPRKQARRLTELETLIMDAVWNLGRANVRDVQERLEPAKPMAYNTVLTMMRILRDKGFLRSERNGRVDVYEPTVSRVQVAKWSLNEILQRFFSGSARALVSQLLDSGELDTEEVQAIRREVDRKLRRSSMRPSATMDPSLRT
jgi:predicted transcriptional regulator